MRRFRHLTFAVWLIAVPAAVAQDGGDPDPLPPDPPARPLPVASTLAGVVPPGALAFGETTGLAEFLAAMGDSEVYRSLAAHGDFRFLMSEKDYKEAQSSLKFAQFILRMTLWEAGTRLLGGRVCIAAYPAGGKEDPHLVLLVRPSQSSTWLKRRIWFAPLARLGLKRVQRLAFGEEVSAYRTRGFDRSKATWFAFHDEWLAVTTDLDLLQKTVALQGGDKNRRAREPLSNLAGEEAFRSMDQRMGTHHLARVFLDTRKISQTAGLSLDDPEENDDPIRALFLGGVDELMQSSRFAGFTLNYEEKGREVRFAACIDARPGEVDPRYRIFFTESSKGGFPPLPEIPGLLGGFSLYREFGEWYRARDESVRKAILPGFGGMESGFGEMLLGDESASPVGDRVGFVSASRDDAGREKGTGIRLPGFAFILDGPANEEQRARLATLFEGVLTELEDPKRDAKKPPPFNKRWRLEKESHHDVPLTVAHYIDESEGAGLDVDPPLVPAAAEVAGKFIISSSRALCRDIVANLRRGEEAMIENRNLVFQVRFKELSKFVESNRKEYEAAFVRDGRTPEDARRDVGNIEKLLSGIDSIAGETTSAGGAFELKVRASLK